LGLTGPVDGVMIINENPSTYGRPTCTHHRATLLHTRKSVGGENHQQFKRTRDTRQAKNDIEKPLYQTALFGGFRHHIKMFREDATRTRGRKPEIYLKLNLKMKSNLLCRFI